MTQTYVCRTLFDAFQCYHQLTNKTWLSCAQFLLETSQNLDGLDGTGILGIGEPNIQSGSHVNVKFTFVSTVPSSLDPASLTIQLQNISFQHAEVDLIDLTVEIRHCTLQDSSLRVNSGSIKGNKLSVWNSLWVGVSNSTGLEGYNMDRIEIRNCSIINTSFSYFHKMSYVLPFEHRNYGWSTIILKYIGDVVVENLSISNTSDTCSNDIVNITVLFNTYYEGVMKISHVNSADLKNISIMNTTGVTALVLDNVRKGKIKFGYFSNNVNNCVY